MTRTGVYQIAKLMPFPSGWDTSIDCYLYDREEAIAWVNDDRPRVPAGTLYRLVELTSDELDELLDEGDGDVLA